LRIAQPPQIVGRDREIARITDVLGHARDAESAAIVRVVGGAGHGKTALIGEILGRTVEDGWLVFSACCYAGQDRTPGAVVRRLVAEPLRTISASDRRYLSGLEEGLQSSETSSARFELAFLRLVEGLLIDRPCLISIDDAHWLDSQTLATLSRLFETNRSARLALLAAHRSSHELRLPPVPEMLTVELQPLGEKQSRDLVATLWPTVGNDVAASLIERSGGVPFDVVALTNQARAVRASTPEDIALTAQSLVRETIARLPDDEREFLQLCSLIGEPAESTVLSRLYKDGNEVDSLIARSERHVSAEGPALRFRHGLVAQAVVQTIPATLKRKLRRRVLDAFLAARSPRASELDRIAKLASEIGEEEIEFRALVTLADLAFKEEAYETVIVALERALQIRRPASSEEFLAIYNQYGTALRLLSRYHEARIVMIEAVADGIGRNFRGVGLLASTLLWTIVMDENRETALSYFNEYRLTITEPRDRHDLLAMGALLAAEGADPELFDAIRREIEAIPETPSRYAAAALHIAEATMMARLGRFPEAWKAISEARADVDTQRSVHKYSVDCFANGIGVKEHGCVDFRIRFSWQQTRSDGSIVEQDPPLTIALPAIELSAIVDFAAGRWDAAIAKLESLDLRSIPPCTARTNLLSIAAAIAALGERPSRIEDLIEADLRLSRERELWTRSRPLAFWWAAYLWGSRPAEAVALVRPLRPLLQRVPDSGAFSFPLDASLYAARSQDQELLRITAETHRLEPGPWDAAQQALAAGVAQRALKDVRAKTSLRLAQRAFEKLQAWFFSSYAAASLGVASAAERELLSRLIPSADAHDRVKGGGRRQPRIAEPTLREREVAELVAEGHTNRAIAERLTLSERTVEVHIANLFGKLNVSNRAQLVKYVVRDSAGAGSLR
jgi:DNA-binding CsgD family transcriptional regulator